MAAFLGVETSAQTAPAQNDSIAVALKLKGLQNRKGQLQKEIKAQDAKRNRQIAGVSPETLEEMNIRQDSICLVLRSELTDVMLEMREVAPDTLSPAIIQNYNNLINKPSAANANANSNRKPVQAPAKQPARKPKK